MGLQTVAQAVETALAERPGGAFRSAELFADLGKRQLLQVAEGDDVTLVFGQLAECIKRLVPSLGIVGLGERIGSDGTILGRCPTGGFVF